MASGSAGEAAGERAGKSGDEVAPSWQGTQSDGGAPVPSWTDPPLHGSAPHVNPSFQGAAGGRPDDHGRPEPSPSLTDARPSLSAAIEATLARYGGMIRRVGWQHRLDEAGVDELVQDVRIRIWRARGDSEQIQQVTSSYMYRTASSAALDLLRRRRAGRSEAVEPEELEARVNAAATAAGPAEELAELELAEVVARAVDTIAPARRPVVRMYLAGYSREEIAGLLGWTEGKTRNLLYRGLADLRGRLLDQGIGWAAEAEDDDPTPDRTARA